MTHLSSDDIAELAQFSLIRYVIAGIKKEKDLYIGVMFDKDEEDLQRSKGTGKIYIANVDERTSYCKLLRYLSNEVVSKRCTKCQLDNFNDVKMKLKLNPNYKGKTYKCSSGGLLNFIVPIVRNEGQRPFVQRIF